MLVQAINAAGGRDALDAARVLTWQGDAVVHAGERHVEISVDTIVIPFRFARSETWLTAVGRSSLRVLEINGEEGSTLINGVRREMSPETTANERAQYALYGLMRLVSLLNTPLTIASLPSGAPSCARHALLIRHTEATPTLMMFGADYRLCAAENVAPSTENGKSPIAQRILFDGTIEGGGVRWPRHISIIQNGTLFFELHLTRFEPRRRV